MGWKQGSVERLITSKQTVEHRISAKTETSTETLKLSKFERANEMKELEEALPDELDRIDVNRSYGMILLPPIMF